MASGPPGPRGPPVVRIASTTDAGCATIQLRRTGECTVVEAIWIHPTALEPCAKVSFPTSIFTPCKHFFLGQNVDVMA